MRHLATLKEYFKTNEVIGPLTLPEDARRAENAGRAQLIEEERVRATDHRGELIDTGGLASNTGIGQPANRGGMRDDHQGLVGQEERKERNMPIQTAVVLDKLYWFVVSLKGKET